MNGILGSSRYPLVQLKHLVRSIPGGTPDTKHEEYWLNGTVPWISISDMSNRHHVGASAKRITEAARHVARLKTGPPGTVLFAMYASVGEIAMTEMEAVWNQALIGLVPESAKMDPRFLQYALYAVKPYLPALYRSNTQNNLNADQVLNLEIPSPSFGEQQHIADYLDREIAEIDELIEDFQRLIILLDERMQSLADAAFSDVHCRLSKMKYLIRGLETGTSVKSAQFEPQQGEPGVLATSAVYSEEYDPSAVKSVDEDEIPRLTCPIRRKTLLMSRMNTPGLVGKAVTVDQDTPNIYLPDRLWQIDLDVPRYLYWWTRSKVYRDEVQLLAVGASSSMKTLSQQDFMSMEVPVPNVETQERIAGSLDAQQAHVQETRANTSNALALINERRVALISAAVTGQIDLTEKRKPVAEVLEDEVGVRI